MAFKLKLPQLKRTTKPVAHVGKKASWLDFKLPLIGALPVARQLAILGGATVVAAAIAAFAVYLNYEEVNDRTEYIQLASGIELNIERLDHDAGLAADGEEGAFKQLAEARSNLTKALMQLDKGSETIPPTKEPARTELNKLLATANTMLIEEAKLEAGRPALLMLSSTVDAMSESEAEFRVLSEQLLTSIGKDQVGQFMLAIERISGDTTTLLASDIDLDDVAQLAIDTEAAEALLAVMPVGAPGVQHAVELFEPYRMSVEGLVGQSLMLVDAKDSVKFISTYIDELAKGSQKLVASYRYSEFGQIYTAVSSAFGILAILTLMLMFKAYLDDSKHQAKVAEETNSRNQKAILRLMNELSDLADGDLTIRATVTEDITGAIADSVNFTTEELRKLVGGINNASEQMTGATNNANGFSRDLISATQKQVREIQDAEESVLLMAKSIQEVDSSAAKASEVGRRTLAATEQGAQAVRNSISGMDGIREQIQETAKRIKRLGESSQEIGEIVDLISDITEQTNVLALNAAIQAASAGEAGRGFSVVAEEVQRLAERSAEATRQIGALVKTIQSDTHDAVSAMEKSTLGVVEGAKLSDVAGQSLKEIEQVSNELAKLINSISVTTQVQTDMVGEVSNTMKEILKITGQTTKDTRLTAESIEQLTKLAGDLKGSVAGFKIQ
ncbi:MAG: methyl-accepting chemotaxis protein [Gallionella sp.]|nr:methyl-accepting chemotaxis protein [Gallionella sp.]